MEGDSEKSPPPGGNALPVEWEEAQWNFPWNGMTLEKKSAKT